MIIIYFVVLRFKVLPSHSKRFLVDREKPTRLRPVRRRKLNDLCTSLDDSLQLQFIFKLSPFNVCVNMVAVGLFRLIVCCDFWDTRAQMPKAKVLFEIRQFISIDKPLRWIFECVAWTALTTWVEIRTKY